jgi:HTH-type transcriptional regulator / antitoxin HipB
MSDLDRYTRARVERDPDFAEGLESGYEEFKIGLLLRRAREEAGLTQEQVAERLQTKKSAISRIENRAGDIRLSTLEKYAKALGRQLSLELQPTRRRRTA